RHLLLACSLLAACASSHIYTPSYTTLFRSMPVPGIVADIAYVVSFTRWIFLISGERIVCISPDGQRISTRSTLCAEPNPKCNRSWFCEQNPLPPVTCCTCCWPSQKR